MDIYDQSEGHIILIILFPIKNSTLGKFRLITLGLQ